MAMPNKKRESCLDILAKQYGSLEVICLDIISRNILRIIKDIAHENIRKEDFEKYATFFTNRQNLIAFRDFAVNRKNIADMYVVTFTKAMEAGNVTPAQQPYMVPQQPMQVQPQMPYAAQVPVKTSMWGSITGQPQEVVPAPTYTPTQQYQPYQTPCPTQPMAPVVTVMSNPCNLATNGLFAQIFDVECRKQKMWGYIATQFTSFEMNYELFVQDYLRLLLGFQSGLINNFRRDFILLDK